MAVHKSIVQCVVPFQIVKILSELKLSVQGFYGVIFPSIRRAVSWRRALFYSSLLPLHLVFRCASSFLVHVLSVVYSFRRTILNWGEGFVGVDTESLFINPTKVDTIMPGQFNAFFIGKEGILLTCANIWPSKPLYTNEQHQLTQNAQHSELVYSQPRVENIEASEHPSTYDLPIFWIHPRLGQMYIQG